MVKIFEKQLWHFLTLIVLLTGLYLFIQNQPKLLTGGLWGISTKAWCVLAILSPILHQVYVLVCWRSELYFQKISNTFGKKGFPLYKVGFAILIMSRLVTLIILAISSAKTVGINSILSYGIAFILFVPSIYLFYSVSKYFGMDRAFGIDHFQPEKIKNEPFVKQGIFKYTSNGMYVYGFLILWIPGVLFQSEAALLVALFNHLYIWVHYYFTELPDIKVIYKRD